MTSPPPQSFIPHHVLLFCRALREIFGTKPRGKPIRGRTLRPSKVEEAGIGALCVATSELHSAIVTDDGLVYTSG